MRKLKLDIDSLVVQTFKTDEAADKQGTVQAHDSVETTTAGPWFCQYECPSLEHSCPPSYCYYCGSSSI